VCGECATEWDGINYCVSCLAEQRRAGRTGRTAPGAVAIVVVSGLLFAAAMRLMVWLGVLVASL
jgi:hypothetical protein